MNDLKVLGEQSSETSSDRILGGIVEVGEDHPDYIKSKEIVLPDEMKTQQIVITNPITGKKAEVTLSREGTTAQSLAMIMLAPDATKDQRNSMLSNYLFEQGKESSSFLAELFVSKGTHTKQTQAFKRQVRYDFEAFATMISLGLIDIGTKLKDCTELSIEELPNIFMKLGEDLTSLGESITKQREKITQDRLREKGYGVYVDASGHAFSIFDDEIVEAVKKDKDAIETESVQNRDENPNEDSRL